MERHQPAGIDRLIEIFLTSLTALPLPWRTAPLGLCLSGGVDSSALAIAASKALESAPEAFPQGVRAFHARHGLRGSESSGDAASVRELCGRLGLALTEVDASVPHGPGLEARARAARYDAIRLAAGPATLLATAHHRDDQTETVLLRLLRGAGPVGLRGIHPLRADGVWRPFLSVPRTSLAAMCEDCGWTPRQDSSNLDTAFARNALRHEFIPALEQEHPGVSEVLAALGDAAQRLEPYIERALIRLSESVHLAVDDRGFSCDLSHLDDPATDPELELLLDRVWTKFGRRPWAGQQRARLLSDAASGSTGRRAGGQGELAIWGSRKLRIERA
ncbi:MAG: tRNA lysidine(34) synthetase TilS [Fibrobacterota bacterium]|jgi:tRNA(Ile)-lysidine synthetase-like protein